MNKLLLAAAMLFALGTPGAYANPDVRVKFQIKRVRGALSGHRQPATLT